MGRERIDGKEAKTCTYTQPESGKMETERRTDTDTAAETNCRDAYACNC